MGDAGLSIMAGEQGLPGLRGPKGNRGLDGPDGLDGRLCRRKLIFIINYCVFKN